MLGELIQSQNSLLGDRGVVVGQISGDYVPNQFGLWRRKEFTSDINCEAGISLKCTLHFDHRTERGSNGIGRPGNYTVARRQDRHGVMKSRCRPEPAAD